MKKIFLILPSLAIFIFGSTLNAVPVPITYSDADYFGTQSGGPNGNPSGIQLRPASGGNPAVNDVGGTFDLVPAANDGTSSFSIFAPYQLGVRGTYSSNLGFMPGVQHIVPGSVFIRFFFRDPNGGSESYVVTVNGETLFTQGNFTVSVALSNNGGTVTIEAALNATGAVAYNVHRTTGEFVFDAAYLEANAVPEGGATAALLGIGLVAISSVRRKLARK